MTMAALMRLIGGKNVPSKSVFRSGGQINFTGLSKKMPPLHEKLRREEAPGVYIVQQK
jgi:hypothetical protein